MQLLAEIPPSICIGTTAKAILRCVLYFDVFDHPLTRKELVENLEEKTSVPELDASVDELIRKGFVKETEGFVYSALSNSSIIDQRRLSNKRAAHTMKKALRYSRLISRFPFVEGVCISGSMSKGVLQPDDDVDYFIITRPSRLWLCRTSLVLFKKIFLLNSKKYFCVNYFVDTHNLLIPDRNIFVATEVKSLLPVYNYSLYEKFIEVNNWADDYLPNRKSKGDAFCSGSQAGFVKRFTEKIFSGSLGEKLDNFFFLLTLRQWQKKFGHFNKEDFDLNMRTRKTISKHHPGGHQYKILSRFSEKMEQFEKNFSISLNNS